MKKKLINIAGFTLIEILIAIVITSLMMAAMFTSYTLVNSTYRQVTDRAKISQAGRDTVGTMLREINASAHTHPFYASVFSASEEPLVTIVPRSTSQPVRPPRWEESADLIDTPEMATSMVKRMGAHHAILLRNHGIVTCGPQIPDPVIVAIALEKMCREVLTIKASGLTFTVPDEDALHKKLESGDALDPAIIGGQVIWRYYCRKLARAEGAGNPLFTKERISPDAN